MSTLAATRLKTGAPLPVSGVIGLGLVVLHLLVALLSGWFCQGIFSLQNPESIFVAPGVDFWLGTDGLGRDVFARTLLGGREALVVSVFATVVAMFTGTLFGMIAGTVGGWLDELIMRLVDLLRTLPWILPVILLISVIGQQLWVMVLVLGIFDGIDVIRVVRSATRSVVNQEYIISARLRGESTITLIVRELFPNISHVLTVEAGMRYSWMLIRFAALSFLGFGASPPTPDWGLMIAENAPYISLAPWASLAPAIALCSLVLGVNLSTNLFSIR